MRRRIRRHIRRKPAPRVRRCACNGAAESAKERMAGAGGLMIGGAKDPAEARADARAARALSAAPAIHRKCAACAEEEARRSPAAGVVAPGKNAAPASRSAEAAVKSLGPGRPLSVSERAIYEPRLGADLAPVRLHENAAADTAARAMDASAFTLGHDIAFAEGARARGGAGLMAHELAHAAEADGGVRRTVAPASTCTDHPASPSEAAALAEIARTDARAGELCGYVANALRAAAQNIDCGGGRALTPYLRWFGMPRRLRGRRPRFRSRFREAPFPTVHQAIAHEMQALATSFDTLATRFGGGIIYTCPGEARHSTGGCDTTRCGTDMALTCRGTSHITLCRTFWTTFLGQSLVSARDARAGVLIHEAVHARLRQPDYSPDLPGFRNFRVLTPECLTQFAMDVVEAELPQNTQCEPVDSADEPPFFVRSMECGGPAPAAGGAAP